MAEQVLLKQAAAAQQSQAVAAGRVRTSERAEAWGAAVCAYLVPPCVAGAPVVSVSALQSRARQGGSAALGVVRQEACRTWEAQVQCCRLCQQCPDALGCRPEQGQQLLVGCAASLGDLMLTQPWLPQPTLDSAGAPGLACRQRDIYQASSCLARGPSKALSWLRWEGHRLACAQACRASEQLVCGLAPGEA